MVVLCPPMTIARLTMVDFMSVFRPLTFPRQVWRLSLSYLTPRGSAISDVQKRAKQGNGVPRINSRAS
jgi:hypothetical protein